MDVHSRNPPFQPAPEEDIDGEVDGDQLQGPEETGCEEAEEEKTEEDPLVEVPSTATHPEPEKNEVKNPKGSAEKESFDETPVKGKVKGTFKVPVLQLILVLKTAMVTLEELFPISSFGQDREPLLQKAPVLPEAARSAFELLASKAEDNEDLLQAWANPDPKMSCI